MSAIEPVMTIGGAAVDSTRRIDVVNPATEQVLGSAPDCSPAQLDDAVAAARGAADAWAARPIDERKRHLCALSDAILAAADDLSRLLTSEQGKTLADARGEIEGAARAIRFWTTLDLPTLVTEDTPERRVETVRVPLGVVAAISPWNFPIVLAIMKVAPAMLAGNSVILKPSPFTPLTTLRVGEIARDILPAGVLNVISGGDQLGPWLTAHPGIDKVSFTGSTETGRRVMESAAPTLKRLTLELGGNDPVIVLPDVDVEQVAPKLFWAAFRNSGQICIAAKRIYVHAAIYDRMLSVFARMAEDVRVGDGTEQGVQLGPLNNAGQFRRVRALIDQSVAAGLRIVPQHAPAAGPGFFIRPAIVDNPPEDAPIVRQEQFGPIVPLMRFDDIDDAIDRANATEYGLGASVWGADEASALAVARRLQSGMVWVNESPTLPPSAPFAGHKQSGVGAENGMEGLLSFTAPRTFVVRHSVST
ncbi:aldehyde dehydrogenase family protein [Sphingomonas sp.]|uniref:aldehyde dehydrogenase family protein n=1 Tax=Sphingomonas sp. TaxID=28214 RepID=UPI002DD68255|nr:aldehyde dehydrogenase family protein [Sphingomonas sp.]